MTVSYLLHLLSKISKKLFRTGRMARTSLLQGIYYSVTKLHHKNYPMSPFSGQIWASCKLFSSAVLDWYHIRGGEGDCYFCIPHCHAHVKQETIVLQNVGGGGGGIRCIIVNATMANSKGYCCYKVKITFLLALAHSSSLLFHAISLS